MGRRNQLKGFTKAGEYKSKPAADKRAKELKSKFDQVKVILGQKTVGGGLGKKTRKELRHRVWVK